MDIYISDDGLLAKLLYEGMYESFVYFYTTETVGIIKNREIANYNKEYIRYIDQYIKDPIILKEGDIFIVYDHYDKSNYLKIGLYVDEIDCRSSYINLLIEGNIEKVYVGNCVLMERSKCGEI